MRKISIHFIIHVCECRLLALPLAAPTLAPNGLIIGGLLTDFGSLSCNMFKENEDDDERAPMLFSSCCSSPIITDSRSATRLFGGGG